MRDQLRQDLREIHQNHGHKLGATFGDFNTDRFLDEKIGGNRLTFSKVESFSSLLTVLSLI